MVDDCLVLTRHNLDKRGIGSRPGSMRTRASRSTARNCSRCSSTLIVNAVQAMPLAAGSRCSARSGWAGPAVGHGDPVARYRAGDRGEDLDRIFDPFFTRAAAAPAWACRSAIPSSMPRRSHHGEQHARCGQRVLGVAAQPARIRRQPQRTGTFEARWRRGRGRRGWRRATSEVTAASETFCRYRRARRTKCRICALPQWQ